MFGGGGESLSGRMRGISVISALFVRMSEYRWFECGLKGP